MSWIFGSSLETARELDKIRGAGWLLHRKSYDQSLNGALKYKKLSKIRSEGDQSLQEVEGQLFAVFG